MIEIPTLWVYVAILATHYVADFVLQTHWQASNKSHNDLALLEHVAVYTVVLGAVTVFMFGLTGLWFAFVWINGILHLCTDYITSRWSASYFRSAVNYTCQAISVSALDSFRVKPYERIAIQQQPVDPAKYWHNFFVVIGFDQLIHQATLAVTLWLIVA